MEVIQIAYRILFNLQFEVEGFLSDLHQMINVVPDAETSLRLQKYSMLRKKQKSTHVFLIETEPGGVNENEPFVPLEANELFRFQVKFSDSAFFKGVHLSGYNFVDQVLVLSNSTNHIVNSELLITLPAVAYNATHTYLPGFIVSSAGNTFMALQGSSNANPHAVSETDFWKPITIDPAVSQADLQLKSSLPYAVDLDTVMIIEVRNSNVINANYRLLDSNDKCREVSYKIRLLKKN